MRNRQIAIGILLVGCVACIHRASSATVLRPLASEYMKPIPGSESLESQYIVFADPFTERLFSSAQTMRRLRVAPTGSTLLCPGVRADGLHGFHVGIHMAHIKGDTAVGVIDQTCQGVTYATSYLLVKQRGAWQIARALGGTVLW